MTMTGAQTPTRRSGMAWWVWMILAIAVLLVLGTCSIGMISVSEQVKAAAWPPKETVLATLRAELPSLRAASVWGPVVTDQHKQRFYFARVDDDHAARAFVSDDGTVVAYGLTFNDDELAGAYARALLDALATKAPASDRAQGAAAVAALAKEAGSDPAHVDIAQVRIVVTGGGLHTNLRAEPVS